MGKNAVKSGSKLGQVWDSTNSVWVNIAASATGKIKVKA